MGTRSTVAFIERNSRGKELHDTELVRIYQQYDGYPSGVGKELATWLSNKTLVNGYSVDQTAENGFCNGVGCMAAQFIHDFKHGIGNLYITTNNDIEDYHYRVIVDDFKNIIILEVYDCDKKLFSSTPQRFLEALDNCEFDE